MILGVGIDMIETARVAAQLEKGNRFREKIFTAGEIAYCESKAHPSQHYAARWCAKEAFFKALGTGWRDGMEFAGVEVTNDELGSPALSLRGKALEVAQGLGVGRMHLSLTHLKETAAAVVILESIST